jgi:hypothetical protein
VARLLALNFRYVLDDCSSPFGGRPRWSFAGATQEDDRDHRTQDGSRYPSDHHAARICRDSGYGKCGTEDTGSDSTLWGALRFKSRQEGPGLPQGPALRRGPASPADPHAHAAGRWEAPSRRPNATSFDFVSPPRRGLTSSSKAVPLALGDQGEHLVAAVGVGEPFAGAE